MRIQIAFGIILMAQLCVGLPRSIREVNRNNNNNIISVSSIFNGDTEHVKSSLNGHLETEKLNKFVDIVWKFRDNAPRGESTQALKQIFALIFASKSSTSESDWLKIMSGDNSYLTQSEINAIRVNAQQAAGDKWRLFKKLAQLRMNTNDANHVNDIMNNLGGNLTQFSKGQKELMTAALAALSNKSENEVKQWIY